MIIITCFLHTATTGETVKAFSFFEPGNVRQSQREGLKLFDSVTVCI